MRFSFLFLIFSIFMNESLKVSAQSRTTGLETLLSLLHPQFNNSNKKMDVKVGQQDHEDVGNIDLANSGLNSEKYFSLPNIQSSSIHNRFPGNIGSVGGGIRIIPAITRRGILGIPMMIGPLNRQAGRFFQIPILNRIIYG